MELLKCEDFKKTAAQIFGCDPYYMRWACESEYLKSFNIVDINMGCPVPKVYKNGEGSALLGDIKRAESIVKECVKSGKIITVKIRTGLKCGDDLATDFCKMAEDAGASLVTIHGRVRENYYSGEVNFKAIEKAKKAVKIPIIANGGIFTKQDADDIMERTGADGIMLARGGIKNPFLVCELLGKTAECSLIDFILLHIDNLVKEKGELKAATEFRKFVNYYFKNGSTTKEFRHSLVTSDDINDIKEILHNC